MCLSCYDLIESQATAWRSEFAAMFEEVCLSELIDVFVFCLDFFVFGWLAVKVG